MTNDLKNDVFPWTCFMRNTFRSAALRVGAPLCLQLLAAAKDDHQPWHHIWKRTYTHTHTLKYTQSAVIAQFLTAFNACVAPGFTRHGLLSYTWPGWVTARCQLLSNRRAVFIPSCSGLSYMRTVRVSLIQLSDAADVHTNVFSMCWNVQSFPESKQEAFSQIWMWLSFAKL